MGFVAKTPIVRLGNVVIAAVIAIANWEKRLCVIKASAMRSPAKAIVTVDHNTIVQRRTVVPNAPRPVPAILIVRAVIFAKSTVLAAQSA